MSMLLQVLTNYFAFQLLLYRQSVTVRLENMWSLVAWRGLFLNKLLDFKAVWGCIGQDEVIFSGVTFGHFSALVLVLKTCLNSA